MITHDLGVVANIAEEVVVMFRGRVTESGSVEDIFRDPRHPYLKALLKAVPRFDLPRGERLVPLREVKAEAGVMLAEPEPWTDAADEEGQLLGGEGGAKRIASRSGRGLGRGAG